MRSRFAYFAILSLIFAACGTAAPGGTQTAATTTAPPVATSPGSASSATPPAPPPGGQVVTVVLTGGPDAGTYTGADNPNCSVGIVGPGGWGTQFSIQGAAGNQLSSLQLVIPAAGAEDDPDSMFSGTKFLMTVVIGPLFETSARTYEVKVASENSGDESSGTGSAEVTDNGATAVIHATGTTAEGVTIDATVNCPQVIRS